MTDRDATASRRDFLATAGAWGAGLGALGHALAWGCSLSPRVLYEPPAQRRLGPAARFPEGVTFLPDHRVFVVRAEGRLRALSAVCTHLGCTVGRGDEGFHCPCHGSRFSAEGKNLAGPAPRPLPWHPLTFAPDGSLVVDLSVEVGPDRAVSVPPGG